MLPQLNRRRFLLAGRASVFCSHAPIATSANDAHRWIIAIGGCGGNLLDACLHCMPMMQRIRTMRIDYATNEVAFRARPADAHVRLLEVFGGSGRDPAQVAIDLSTHYDLTWRNLDEATAVLIIAGIGGGTGYGATLALVGQLLQQRLPCDVIAVMPFSFE